MNQTQFQQEPETTLPRIEQSPTVSEAAVIAAPLEAVEVASEQSAAVEKLLAALEQNSRKRQKLSQTTSALYLISIVIFFLVMVAGWINGHRFVHAGDFNLLHIFNAFGWVIGAFLLDRKAAAELTQLDDARCIGALVEIWNPQGQGYNRNTRQQAETALIRLLPRLNASDAPLLKESQRAILRNILAMDGYKQFGRYYDEAFLIAILKTFAQIGDWKSVTQVRKLAAKAKRDKVREAAKDCLPFLEELATKQRAAETLLRASGATEAANIAPETLLRPAAPAADTQPETLLRPIE